MFSTNLEIETVPTNCQFSKDTVRKKREGCALTEDKIKATAMWQSGLGWFPRPCAGCHFRLTLLETSVGGKLAGNGPAQYLSSPSPSVPPRGEPGALEWPQTCWPREEELTFLQPTAPMQYRLLKGFQVPIPRTPDPCTHLKFGV